MSTASDLERQMLALINEERTSRGLQPLVLERQLNDSAEDHSEWMLNTNTFSHTGAGGSSATQRMRDAGFDFTGSWRSGENIAWQSERGPDGASDDVVQLHQSLMDSEGHRANILNADFKYIGIGIEEGNFNGWDAIMVTQNFALTSAPVQLDITSSSSAPIAPSSSAPIAPAALEDAASDPVKKVVTKTKSGTDGDDWFVLKKGGNLYGRDGDDILIGSSKNNKLVGGEGNDRLEGRSGNDKAYGGIGDDLAKGGGGKDRLYGQEGSDRLYGGGKNDKLYGGSDNDVLKGGSGKDRLNGGSGDDVMVGGKDADRFVFSSGNDRITDLAGNDLIDLRKVDTITSFSDLKNNHMQVSGSDVIIYDGLGNTLLLEDTSIGSLGSNDFLI